VKDKNILAMTSSLKSDERIKSQNVETDVTRPTRISRIVKRLRSVLGNAGMYSFLISAFILLCIIIIGIVVPVLSERDPLSQNLRDRHEPPSLQYPLGTDGLGRDVFIRVLYGARTSLGISITAATFTAILGALLGFMAGFIKGRLDLVFTRANDVLMAFPTVLLAIIIISVMGSGVINLIIAIIISSLPRFFRVARSAALSIRETDYIIASQSFGTPIWRQIWWHVIPNGLPIVVILATARLGTVILTEASLSFLGLGVPPGTPSWGAMISEGRTVMREAPWLSLAPGIAIMTVVLCFNLLGDAVRDLADPYMRGAGLRR
jgi:peptide/nickel transport system permease protein